MAILIGRPINGITINGLEYACDDDGYAIRFNDEGSAREYLRANGYTDEDIDNDGIEFVDDDDDD